MTVHVKSLYTFKHYYKTIRFKGDAGNKYCIKNKGKKAINFRMAFVVQELDLYNKYSPS